jgi:hypothetical protein
MTPKVLIVGTGDSAERLLMQILQRGRVTNVIVCGRNKGRGRDITWSASAAMGFEIPFIECDASNESQISNVMERTRPDAIINCASLCSPYFFSQRSDAISQNMVAAGFVSQLPMHIKLLITLMRAAKSVGEDIQVVNLSAPELTGPVLKTQGLAPTIGIGNVGILFKGVQVQANREAPNRQLRMFAHHSHIRAIRRHFGESDLPKPIVYLDEEQQDWDRYQAWESGIPYGGILTNLTAAIASEVTEALIGVSPKLRTSAPAPGGIAAGLPVIVAKHSVTLDLPAGFSLDKAIELNEAFARYDGIQNIDKEGTVTFTEDSAAALARIDPELAKPLRFSDIEGRSAILVSIIRKLRGEK